MKTWVPSVFADKLTSASRDTLSTHTSPSQSPGSVHGSRRGSIGSVSSVSSVLDEKEDERIRCCGHCKDTLLRKEQQMDEREHTPAITRLYEVTMPPCLWSAGVALICIHSCCGPLRSCRAALGCGSSPVPPVLIPWRVARQGLERSPLWTRQELEAWR